MARINPIRRLMLTPLPTISEQKRKPYRPNRRQVCETYDLINHFVFKNYLRRPPIYLGPWKNVWGMCIGSLSTVRPGTKCSFKLVDRYYCVQWFVMTMAHEMVHQYEWDILDKVMTHRQSFFFWRDRLDKYGVPLRSYHNSQNWFQHQNIYRS